MDAHQSCGTCSDCVYFDECPYIGFSEWQMAKTTEDWEREMDAFGWEDYDLNTIRGRLMAREDLLDDYDILPVNDEEAFPFEEDVFSPAKRIDDAEK